MRGLFPRHVPEREAPSSNQVSKMLSAWIVKFYYRALCILAYTNPGNNSVIYGTIKWFLWCTIQASYIFQCPWFEIYVCVCRMTTRWMHWLPTSFQAFFPFNSLKSFLYPFFLLHHLDSNGCISIVILHQSNKIITKLYKRLCSRSMPMMMPVSICMQRALASNKLTITLKRKFWIIWFMIQKS